MLCGVAQDMGIHPHWATCMVYHKHNSCDLQSNVQNILLMALHFSKLIFSHFMLYKAQYFVHNQFDSQFYGSTPCFWDVYGETFILHVIRRGEVSSGEYIWHNLTGPECHIFCHKPIDMKVNFANANWSEKHSSMQCHTNMYVCPHRKTSHKPSEIHGIHCMYNTHIKD